MPPTSPVAAGREASQQLLLRSIRAGCTWCSPRSMQLSLDFTLTYCGDQTGRPSPGMFFTFHPQTQKTFSKYYHSKFAAFQSAPGCHADDGPRTRRHRTSYTETNGTDLNNKTGTTGEEMILFCWVSGGFPINIPRQDAQGIPQTS